MSPINDTICPRRLQLTDGPKDEKLSSVLSGE